jgi:NAD(P)-dependent dehydrogenase (short-subunit alcohol dehydrogenase family)
MLTYDYSGKVALVTGSSRGIGFATAKMFLEAGAKVMINGSNPARLDAALKSLSKYKSRVIAHKADLKSRAEIEAMFKHLFETWGGIDILVNNAADRPVMKVIDMTDDVWDRNMDTKLRGGYICSQIAARRMIEQGRGGKMVFVASGSWKVAREAAGAYCASNGGMVMFANCLALELGWHKINVNSVAPGLIEVGEEQTPSKAAYDRAMVNMTPWGRIGVPDDIANAILMLCSPQADFITGTVLSVDGGISTGRYGIPVSPF